MPKFSLNYILLSTFLFTNCNNTAVLKGSSSSPKNVIFLISDGAGLSQISSAYYFKNSSVHYSRFKHIGLIQTHSSDSDITDSAACGTAFATGNKTYNGAIGVLDDFTRVGNLVEIASANGVKTAIVSTSSITHATPASFYAHVESRNQEKEIARQLSESDVDFFAGGGINYFSHVTDRQNLFDILGSKGFTLNTKELDAFESIKNKNKLAYLLADTSMPRVLDGRGDFLKNATLLGIEFLNQNDQPFFMMSEGSQVDWGGHANDAEYLISELIDFDETIGAVLDFAEKDGETLVIVTSDHETGGFTLSGKKYTDANGNIHNDYRTIDPSFSTGGHSATLIPVFAYGPGSEEFIGIYDNTDIFYKILKITNWKN
jgi:alkaline phosphatase